MFMITTNQNIRIFKALLFSIVSLAICIIIYSGSFKKGENGEKIISTGDTVTYMLSSGVNHILHPFIGHNTRNFGYPMFISFFLGGKHSEVAQIVGEGWASYPKDPAERERYVQKALEERLYNELNGIIYTQIVGYFIAFILLYFSICKLLGGYNDIFIILGTGLLICLILYKYPLYNARIIATEPLSIICCSLFISFLLLYKKFNNIIFLSFSFFFATYAYFIRPNMICLVALASIYLIYLIYINRNFRRFIMPIVFILFAFAYIIELSIISGHLCFGAMDSLTNIMFYSYYANKDDLDNMPSNSARDYHKIFIETKNSHPTINENGYKEALKNKNYVIVVDSLMFSHPSVIDLTQTKFNESHPDIPYNYLNLSRLGYDLKKGVIRNHWKEIIQVFCHGFASGIGISTIMPNWPSASLPPAWVIWILLPVWMCAVICCRNARFALLLLICVHALSIAAICIGHGIYDRYIDGTNMFYLLGLGLSCLCLASLLWKNIIKKRSFLSA